MRTMTCGTYVTDARPLRALPNGAFECADGHSRGAAEPGDGLLQVVEGTLFLLRGAPGHLEHAVAACADPGVSIEADNDVVHQLLLRTT
ncbi:hypothetical protein ACFRLW_43440, partial [Streptomyces sp. NPDC056728]